MGKGVCERLGFKYELFTSSDNLSEKNSNVLYKKISNGCYTYGKINLVGWKLLTLYFLVRFIHISSTEDRIVS